MSYMRAVMWRIAVPLGFILLVLGLTVYAKLIRIFHFMQHIGVV